MKNAVGNMNLMSSGKVIFFAWRNSWTSFYWTKYPFWIPC